MTILQKTGGEISNVRGTFNEVVEGFKSKGATITPSRLYENSVTVWINDINAGSLIHPSDLALFQHNQELLA